MPKHSRHLRGILITSLGVFVLTPDALLIRMIQTDAWTLLFWRGLLQFVTLIAGYFFFYRSRAIGQLRAVGMMGLVVGATYAGGNILFIHSIRTTSVSNTLLIVSSAPLIAAVLSHLFLHEKTALRTWLAALASMMGVGIIFSGGFQAGSMTGDALALASAICMASSFVLIRRAHLVNMIPAVAISGLLIALLVAPVVPEFMVTGKDALLLGILGAVIMPVAFGLITLGPRYITAPEVSLIMLIETVLGPTWVWLMMGEIPSLTTLIGGSVVLGALILHSILSLRKTAT